MSLLRARDVAVKQVMNPAVDINEKKDFAVLKSALQTTQRSFTSTSYSTTSAFWSAPPPNENTIVNRRILMRFAIRATCTAGSFIPYLNSAPRFMPLSSIVNSAVLTLNNIQIPIQLQEVLVPLARCMASPEQLSKQFSTTPSQMDQYADYSQYTTLGTARNVMANFGENSFQPPRGGTAVTYSVGNTVADFTVEEPLMLSPCRWGDEQTPGFIGLQTIELTLNFGNIDKVMSNDNVNNPGITSLSISFPTPPVLDFEYYTPPVGMPIPRSLTYDYSNVQRFTTAYGNLATGVSATISSTSVQLNAVPKKILICVRQQLADQTFQTSDHFCRVNSISLNWNNTNSLLSNASPQQLYNMSKVAGYSYSWDDWYNKTGSVLALLPGIAFDLNNAAGEAPGVLQQTTVQFNLNVTNIGPNTENMVLYMIVVYEGICTIANGFVDVSYAALTQQDVIASGAAPMVKFHDAYAPHRGGDFLGSLKSFGSRVADVAKIALPFVGPLLAKAALSKIGIGGGRGNLGGRHSGGAGGYGMSALGDLVASSGGRRRRHKRGGGDNEGSDNEEVESENDNNPREANLSSLRN